MQIPVDAAGSITAATPISTSVGSATQKEREGAAHHLANVIVWSFCIAVAWLLLESAYLLYRVTRQLPSMPLPTTSEAAAKQFEFISAALVPFLKESASTVTSIFGSTLGFVLGYYFKNESSSNK